MNHFPIACLLLTAVALGQAPVLVQQASASGTGLASLSMNLDNLPAVGNVLVICHDSTSGGSSSVSGGGVTSWTLCQSTLPADNSEIFAGVVDGTPDTAILITLGGSPNSASAIASEWQGLALPLAFTGLATTGSGSTVASNSVFAYANDLVVATVGLHATGGTIGAPSNGFVDLARPTSQPSSVMAASYLLPASNGQRATTWQMGFHHVWVSAIVVFRGPGPAAPSLVQQTAGSGPRFASLVLALGQPPTPGNLLVLCDSSSSRSSSLVSGGGVSHWNLCQSTLPGKDNVEIWAGMVDGAPATAITLTLGGGVKGSASAIASEWQGFASTPLFAGAATSGSNGAWPSPVTTGTLSVVDNDLVIAAAAVNNGRVVFGSASNGFADFGRPPAQPADVLAASWWIPAAQGTASTTWSLSQRNVWASAIVVFHAP